MHLPISWLVTRFARNEVASATLEKHVAVDDEDFLLYVGIAVLLVLVAGLMSGLTLGLLR